ncbi:metalloregulator ArsR/SmtB family transcription factor [Desulfurispirillum indicum]|uniref:Regulatory protein ArsR n=1 Tax=Desulfurispirillum indicum (strain ATCC BAA-1389 / DSM 22839 / S5) TaxID=653733 RepID=E6W536_DESIS|nr:metalloregulator ArsR/SmtB family transcription factor [Desulfurispirillum indicum]ADU66012.1 regulatory protein ArsR [Desulfurispirillum indicum S5]UCZ57951.1 metalloregulator ArsR/SmtB family transcription factor [Desulfurispirillum indicum]
MNIRFDDIATKFKCLSDPTRLQILHLLMEGEHCVGDIALKIGTTQANISKHLSLLKNAGLVVSNKQGMKVIYSLQGNKVQQLCQLMCSD